MYKYVLDPITKTNSTAVILRVHDNACVPIGVNTKDSLEYSAWLAAGNTPLPA